MKNLLVCFLVSLIPVAELSAQADTADHSGAVTLEKFERQTGNKEVSVLVFFHADWCSLCAAMRATIRRVIPVYGQGINVLDIDTDRDREVADRYEIDALPVTMLFQGGQCVWIHVGLMNDRGLREELDCYMTVPNKKETAN